MKQFVTQQGHRWERIVRDDNGEVIIIDVCGPQCPQNEQNLQVQPEHPYCSDDED